MANYTDDAVKAKLSSLNETQDSIVSVAQWLLFYRRHAARTAELWHAKLKESSGSKRLNLIYLANEVVQQSKARKKEDFVSAFTPIIAEGTAIAYKSAPLDIQTKIRRVVEVWRQRSIFDLATQDDVEKRCAEIDQSRGSRLGGALFSSAPAPPPQFQTILSTQTELDKVTAKTKAALDAFNSAYLKIPDTLSDAVPGVTRAATLSTLLQNLADSETHVSSAIATRKTLIEALEKLLAENKAALSADEGVTADLGAKKASLTDQKKTVEDQIIQGIVNGGEEYEPPRPDTEPLTPPQAAAASTTPPGSPKHFDLGAPVLGASVLGASRASKAPLLPASDLSSLSVLANFSQNGTQTRPLDNNGAVEQPAKRRRLDQGDEFAAFAGNDVMAGLDPDVANMLE